MSVGCVLLAAGRSARMGGGDKLLADLAGRPVLAHSLAALAACDQIAHVVVVTGPANRAAVAQLARSHGGGKLRALATGGAQRQDSVAAGLAALPNVELIAVHDGARPLVDAEDFSEGVRIARELGAAIAGAPVADTIKRVDSAERVIETPPATSCAPPPRRRSSTANCWSGRTATRRQRASRRPTTPRWSSGSANRSSSSPRAAATSKSPPPTTCGSPKACSIRRRASCARGSESTRIASKTGRRLVLGGVEIRGHDGLGGHSDADAPHPTQSSTRCSARPAWAISDSTSRPAIRNGPAQTASPYCAARWICSRLPAARPQSVDATVIAERPRLAPHIAAMRESLAQALDLETRQVNVKATTAEGMGALGRGEGIQAHAAATVRVTLLDAAG